VERNLHKEAEPIQAPWRLSHVTPGEVGSDPKSLRLEVPKPKKISAAALEQIPALIDRGLSTAEIADAIGCTVGTLRVKCSQTGISLRRKYRNETGTVMTGSAPLPVSSSGAQKLISQSPPKKTLFSSSGEQGGLRRYQTSMAIFLPRLALDQLGERATAKGVSISALASMLLEVVARDGLYDAILDGLEPPDQPVGKRELG